MIKLTKVQQEAMDFMKNAIDEARMQNIDVTGLSEKQLKSIQAVLDAQKGIVFSPGGDCTIRTLRALEAKGLIEVLEDNSGIGTGFGAFPSKVKVLNY